MPTIKMPPYIRKGDRVILFDGLCKLCNAWANFIIEKDSHHCFKLCSVQSRQGQEILIHFELPTDQFETMLYVADDQCFTKSDAFLRIMNKLQYPWKLLILFRLIPRPIRDWCYDRIALNRYALFGKYDYCALPTPDHDRRFIDDKH
ncbi:thiol-disulfide oxidoreductase DCC family protein [Aestuariirhabdus sp. Z084]|uniref:thiol-disulfide oxidoreductase DCC family protein n=1 Tax=Aestuariirhabdus haliotis TaxID=2918751 RepID=UPI00201B3765|nr:thiol-disulfide oxidoreductase DCC family protein [Aestuariirhabdus haliotis]MCL6415816.1 thiol-disulfide oxidoreductase DCC family protein [Aestuariirhabdus haliotis]MCL6419882.1 thiol-disulfide oxidoreductase DCC family protein [Aestuariirhabdus haliotis]